MPMRHPALLLGLTLALAPAQLAGQVLRGKAVDPDSVGLTGVMVTVRNIHTREVRVAQTNAQGLFEVPVNGPGAYHVLATRFGFSPDSLQINILNTGTTQLASLVLRPEPVAMDTVTASGRRTDPSAGMTRAGQIVAGARLALIEQQGGTLVSVVREIEGLRVLGNCIQSLRRSLGTVGRDDDCVVLVIDGVVMADDPVLMRHTLREPLSNWESVQYLTPVEAGSRYGIEASARGALLLWTRGRGPHVSPARNRK